MAKRKAVRPSLYRHGAKKRQLKSFQRRYGKRGKYVYGATVGKIKRLRQRKYSLR